MRKPYIDDRNGNVSVISILATYLFNEVKKNRGSTIFFNSKKLFRRAIGRLPTKRELFEMWKLLDRLYLYGLVKQSRGGKYIRYMMDRSSPLYRYIKERCSSIEELTQYLDRVRRGEHPLLFIQS